MTEVVRKLSSNPQVLSAFAVMVLCASAPGAASAREKAAGAAEYAGIVLKIEGKWTAQTKNGVVELTRGASIPDGARLKADSKNASVSIVLKDGTKLRCPQDPGCKKPVSMAKTPTATDSWLAAAVNVICGKSKTWVTTASRPAPGADSAFKAVEIEDSVVVSEGDRVSLRSVFASAPAGTYFVRISRPPGQSQDESESEPKPVELTSGTSYAMSAAGLSPGLYLVDLLNNEPPNDVTGKQAAILIAAPAAYDWLSKRFNQAKDEAAQQASDASSDLTHKLLRAYLAALSIQAQPR